MKRTSEDTTTTPSYLHDSRAKTPSSRHRNEANIYQVPHWHPTVSLQYINRWMESRSLARVMAQAYMSRTQSDLLAPTIKEGHFTFSCYTAPPSSDHVASLHGKHSRYTQALGKALQPPLPCAHPVAVGSR